MIDIFTSEDMENISPCIFKYLTLYYIIKYFTIMQSPLYYTFLMNFNDISFAQNVTLITDSEAIMHGVNYVGVYIRLTKNCTCFSFYNCNYPFNLTKMFDFSLSASDRVCIFSVVTR